jgi:hypothetical protein
VVIPGSCCFRLYLETMAAEVGARPVGINRPARAFDHDDLTRAKAL